MAQKDVLKQLLDQLFPDNDDGLITPAVVRQYLEAIINFIPEDAGGDLIGTYPNPTIRNESVDETKIAHNTINPRHFVKSAAPCKIGPKNLKLNIMGTRDINITDLLTYDSAHGWISKIVYVYEQNILPYEPHITLRCDNIPPIDFVSLPTLIPVLIYCDDDFNAGSFRVISDIGEVRPLESNKMNLWGTCAYISLLLAKTATGYLVVGSTIFNGEPDFL